MTDFDANEFLSGVGSDGDGDSDLVKLLRAKVREAAKRIKSLSEENAKFKEAETRKTLDATWEELKVPEAVRKFYTGEPTAEAVKKWFDENKAVFNLGGSSETDEDAGQEQTPEQQAQAQQLQQQLQGVTQAANLGFDAPNVGLEALAAQGQQLAGKSAAANMADLDAYLAKLGFTG